MLWVHVTCAWFRPEVIFRNHEAMEPASGILKIPPNSFLKVKYKAKVFLKVFVRGFQLQVCNVLSRSTLRTKFCACFINSAEYMVLG